MSRIMSKEEFKEKMRFAAADMEAEETMDGTYEEVPEDVSPKMRPGRHKKAETEEKRNKTSKTVSNRQKTSLTSKKTSKSAPVAAGRKKRAAKLESEVEKIIAKTVDEAMEKASRQEQALNAATIMMEAFVEHLIKGAKEDLERAERFAGYTEILKEMMG